MDACGLIPSPVPSPAADNADDSFCLRRRWRKPKNSSARSSRVAPTPIPTPIPILAPVDRPASGDDGDEDDGSADPVSDGEGAFDEALPPEVDGDVGGVGVDAPPDVGAVRLGTKPGNHMTLPPDAVGSETMLVRTDLSVKATVRDVEGQ